MMKEILEQPQSIKSALKQDPQEIMDWALDILRAKQVVLIGCGTSRHAALLGRYAFSKLAGIFSEVIAGSEFQYFSDSVNEHTVVIAVSRSGETTEVIQGVKKARQKGAKIFSIVNSNQSTLAQASNRSINIKCGPEKGIASTKSFISELTIFYLLAFAMQNRQEEGRMKLQTVADLIHEYLNNEDLGLAQLADKLKDKINFYCLGSGINYAIASECTLKFKEVAFVQAQGMSTGELNYSLQTFREEDTPIIALCPNDYTYAATIPNITEAKSRGSYIIGISDQNNQAFNEWIPIPTVEEIFYPMVSIIPLQILAYHSAIARGFDLERPLTSNF